MSRVTRRRFLSGAATAVGAAALPGVAAAASRNQAAAARKRVRLSRSEERVVVIGSGFGGGVTSLRLAQAGVDVLVLERGRWWHTGPNAETFPRVTPPDRRVLFYSIWPELGSNPLGLPAELPPYVGLLEPVIGDGIIPIVPAGVGGGSLIYQGMTLQPVQEVFETWFPSGIDYAQMNAIYYPRVAKMLKIETAPDALINSKPYYPPRQFAANVQSAGYELSKIPMPIDWRYALAELAGEMRPAYTNSDGSLGINNGGKHSVDVTYIAQGQATGRVRVAPQHNVTGVAEAKDGRWEVYVNVTDSSGDVLEQKLITTRAVVLAAGTVNTSRLLVSAKGRGTISDLPDEVGQGYGTNGDQICTWTDLVHDFGRTQGGPVVYGSFEWNDPNQPANTIIQASIPPIGLNLDGWQPLPNALLPGATGFSKQLDAALNDASGLLATLTSRITTPGLLDTHTTIVVGYGVSTGRGHFSYDARTDKVDLFFPAGGDSALAARVMQRLNAVAGRASIVLNTNDVANTTWHSLGGACIDKVCDLEGRVLGKKGLYVLDGALMPGTTCACNPSMTIAAIAERALDRIVTKDIGTAI